MPDAQDVLPYASKPTGQLIGMFGKINEEADDNNVAGPVQTQQNRLRRQGVHPCFGLPVKDLEPVDDMVLDFLEATACPTFVAPALDTSMNKITFKQYVAWRQRVDEGMWLNDDEAVEGW